MVAKNPSGLDKEKTMLKWISESDALPEIAQQVFLASVDIYGEYWKIQVASILVRHEGVTPHPVKEGDKWPHDFYWSTSREQQGNVLINGRKWWASMSDIPLPPGAKHETCPIAGYDYVVSCCTECKGEGFLLDWCFEGETQARRCCPVCKGTGKPSGLDNKKETP